MIDETRAEECFDLLGELLNTSDDSEYNFEGSKIKIREFVPVLMKHLFKLAMTNEGRSEGIMNFVVDSIHYTLRYSDDTPRIHYITEKEQNEINSMGHEEPKIKVITKK